MALAIFNVKAVHEVKTLWMPRGFQLSTNDGSLYLYAMRKETMEIWASRLWELINASATIAHIVRAGRG